MPSIVDVAREAGVSTATVSRAINTPEKVAQKTRRRVNAAIEKLQYNPEENRSTLSAALTHMILIIIPDFSNMFFSDILSGMNESALKNGYSLLVAASNSIIERERELVKLLDKRQADGVIFLSPLLSDEELKRISFRYPLVQCCEYSETSALTHVSIDNYDACRTAMEYLISLGHRKIAMLSSTNRFISTKQRESAYKAALSEHGIDLIPGLQRRGTYSFFSGYENMRQLLKHPQRPTAVLAVADTVAAGAMRAISEAGLRVPEDISVIGFDNVDLCSMITPTLTTMSQPRKRLGMTAVELIMEKISGDTEQKSIYLPHELIVRQSTR